MRPGLVIGVAAVSGLVLSLAASRLNHVAPQHTALVTPPTVQPPSPTRVVIGSVLEGRLVAVTGTALTVEDVFGAQQTVRTMASTEVSRGAGYVYVDDHDLSRLQPGDYLWIAGNSIDSGVFEAGRISANGFIGRDGIITTGDETSIDVRLRKDRLSREFQDAPTRFILDPAVQVQSPRGLTLATATAGTGAIIQGFIADDGSYVALFIWLYEP